MTSPIGGGGWGGPSCLLSVFSYCSGLCLPQVGTPQAQASQTFQEVSGLRLCSWTRASLSPACKYVQTCFITFLNKVSAAGVPELMGFIHFMSHTHIASCAQNILLLLTPHLRCMLEPSSGGGSVLRSPGVRAHGGAWQPVRQDWGLFCP